MTEQIIDSTDTKAKVFYDGSCPICVREIGFYRNRNGADSIDWVDITKLETDMVCDGLSRDDAMARFSVLAKDGSLRRGASGFVELWKELPAFRFVGVLLSFPPFVWMLDRVYDILLIVRPHLQKLFRKTSINRD